MLNPLRKIWKKVKTGKFGRKAKSLSLLLTQILPATATHSWINVGNHSHGQDRVRTKIYPLRAQSSQSANSPNKDLTQMKNLEWISVAAQNHTCPGRQTTEQAVKVPVGKSRVPRVVLTTRTPQTKWSCAGQCQSHRLEPVRQYQRNHSHGKDPVGKKIFQL